jgi:phosphatidylinositol alpha-1,6-mannosyltransferase
VLGCRLSPIPLFLWSCQIASLRAAQWFEPDLVIAGSGATAPAALMAARRARVPSVCYLHGLDLAARSLAYKSVFLPAIRRCDRLFVNSDPTRRLAEGVGVPAGRIRVLHPGVSLPDGKADGGSFRVAAGIDAGSPILLSVGRLVPRKGLVEFVTRILPKVAERRPDVVLAIVGSEPEYALWHRGGERARIEAAAAAVGVTRNIRMLGAVSDERLNQAYAAAQLLVLPLREVPGDVEGFGMVALEAAAHGVPTAAFALGGVTDAVAHGDSGYLIDPGDDDAFVRAILRHLEEDPRAWALSSRRFAERFAWPRFGEHARHLCRELIGRT